jgi:hypothetical protein
VYVLKQVSDENQQQFNKHIQIHCKEFFQKGEQMSARTLQEIYEDRLMSVKRATNVPKQVIQEAEQEWDKATKEHEFQARSRQNTQQQQQEPAANHRNHQKQAGPASSNQEDQKACQRTSSTSDISIISVSANLVCYH